MGVTLQDLRAQVEALVRRKRKPKPIDGAFLLEIQEPRERVLTPPRADPYLLTGPTLNSFSGGRTSAYMLRQLMDRHGGGLPPDCVTAFANTGRERPETLDFVREVGERWGVPIVWVEYGRGVVTYETASRDGEPFAALIRERKYLPNVVTRFCTTELKVRPMRDVMRAAGYSDWDVALGIRADEPSRLAKLRAPTKEAWERIFPLADAGVSLRDVRAFWDAQPFDLQLLPSEGNCDLCYLKGRDKLVNILKARPDLAAWWIEREDEIGATFRADRSYDTIAALAAAATYLSVGDADDLGECQCHD